MLKLNAKRLQFSLTILLLASFLVFVRPAKAAAPNRVLVSPTISTPQSNLNFTVDVTIEMFERMSAYQVSISWNPALLQISHGDQPSHAIGNKTIQEGPFLSNGGQVSTYFIVTTYPVQGMLSIIDSQLGDPYANAVTGNGTLFTIVFQANGGPGYCALHLHDTRLLLGTSTFLGHTTVDGQFDYQVYAITRPDTTTSTILIESNSTVTDFGFSDTNIQTYFNVSAPTGATGYANVTIPKDLLNVDPSQPPYDWSIILDNVPETNHIITHNDTHTFIYLTYSQGQHSILIIGNTVPPEYPVGWIPLLALVAFAITSLLARRFSECWRSRQGKSRPLQV